MATKAKKAVKKIKKVTKTTEKKQKLQKFSVEIVQTFYEVMIVNAKDEDEARFIAENADYNASKWLGSQIVQVLPCSDEDKARFRKLDDYFFEGTAEIDGAGNLIYRQEDGSINENMKPRKIR